MQWKINDTMICLRMGKNLTAKIPPSDFRSSLSKLHYYHNKRLQVRNPKYLTNLQLNPYPNTQSNLFCSDSFPFWCTAPNYMTNQLHGSQYVTSITNLKRLFTAKSSVHPHYKDQEDAWSQNPMMQIHSNFSKKEMN